MKKQKGYLVRWDGNIYKSKALAVKHFKRLFEQKYGKGRYQGIELFGNVLPVWAWLEDGERKTESREERAKNPSDWMKCKAVKIQGGRLLIKK